LTTGTRRNGSSKVGPFARAAAPQYYAPFDQTSAYRDAAPVGYESAVQVIQPVWVDYEDAAVPASPPGGAGHAGNTGRAGRAPEPGRGGGRYAGRHASNRGKATVRKHARKVVPVAAVAALAAGTAAAYGLSGGGQASAGNASAALALHGTVASGLGASAKAGAGAGSANGATAATVPVATATASAPARAPKHAKSAPRRTPAATQTAAASSPAAASAPAPAAPAVTHAAPAASSPATTKPAAATTLSCNLSYSLLPDNVTPIVSFLLANGYTDNAAAGIAGNIYQESKGNPESEGMGGGGLIGWTPLPSGFVTGNASADLQTQLNALLTYNQGWAQFVPALNAAASPAAAADIYVTDFERAGIPAASTREASATNVASACGI
jgi:hypothetical protein